MRIEMLESDQIETKVVQTHAPVALDFYQASCAPCRALEPRLGRVAEQYRDAVTVYRVDIDRDLPIARRLGVTSLPTVIVLDSGREVEWLDGLITESALLAAFKRAAGRRTGETKS